MTSSELKAYFDAFDNMTAMVIGDVMVDAYLYGKVERISPEAPVPVVNVVKDQDNRLGGAANVALNLKALGAKAIICSVIGSDEAGYAFQERMKGKALSTDGLVVAAARPTTIKTRVICGQHQMLRIDKETTAPLSAELETQLLETIKTTLDKHKIDVIIFEDYDKGVITKRIIDEVVAAAKAKGIPTAVDPKKQRFLDYRGVTLFKPNLKEIKEGLHIEIDPAHENELIKSAEALHEKLGNALSLITLSEHGIFVYDKTQHYWHPAMEVNIADVSGAGDTVISVAALCLAAGMDLPTMAILSNMAGGQVCEKVGVVPVNKQALLNEAIQRISLS